MSVRAVGVVDFFFFLHNDPKSFLPKIGRDSHDGLTGQSDVIKCPNEREITHYAPMYVLSVRTSIYDGCYLICFAYDRKNEGKK